MEGNEKRLPKTAADGVTLVRPRESPVKRAGAGLGWAGLGWGLSAAARRGPEKFTDWEKMFFAHSAFRDIGGMPQAALRLNARGQDSKGHRT
jgi:hypothetical protein